MLSSFQNRNAPSKDIFEPAITDREWWRVTLKVSSVQFNIVLFQTLNHE